MRTTIELPDDLFREAKICAARQGTTLKELMTECIRSGLRYRTTGGRSTTTRRNPPPVAIRRTPNQAAATFRAKSNRQLNAILEEEEIAALRSPETSSRRGQ